MPPAGIDTTTLNTARVWNALVGGKDHFAADREAVRAFLTEMPSLAEAARLARRFQGEAVRRLVELGWRQFLDIGTGLPVAGAVHGVAQRLAPQSRVVYVDNDSLGQCLGPVLSAVEWQPYDEFSSGAR
jgi:hypothetical protein